MRRGLALVLVVGVLGILAVLGSAFAVLSRLERKSAMQRVWSTRAYLLARSGIEDARARLDAGMDPDAPRNRYGGEDWDLSGGALSVLELQNEVHRPGRADAEPCPVRFAMRPSFGVLAGPDPRLVPVDGRLRGYSGRLASEGASWALKVQPQAGFFLNGQNPSQRRILETLAEAIDREDGADDGLPVDEKDGQQLVDARPAPGWSSWAEVRDLALGGDGDRLEALKPYLSLDSWVDRRVIRPNADPADQDRKVQSWGEIKRSPPAFEPRAPVHLGWARRRRPALVALLAGLKGQWLDEREQSSAVNFWTFVSEDWIGGLKASELPNTWTPDDPCQLTATSLLSWTGELSTWDQWDAFCDGLDPMYANWLYCSNSLIPGVRHDLLKAAFNPNGNLNKLNPNLLLWRWIDKADLLSYSTELTLEPLHGHEVESVGRVLDADGRLRASRALSARLPRPSVVRLSTQRELACADLGSLDAPGDETGPRAPLEYLSPNRTLDACWGSRLAAVGGRGVALQTYPEPYADAGGGLALRPADYDGSLQLSTLETPPDATYQVDSPPNDMKMMACFDDGYDLDDGTDAVRTLQPDVRQAPASNSVLDPVQPGTLYPDGCFSERGRVPAYLDAGNANGLHGLISFWVKPGHHEYVYPPAGPCRGRPYLEWTNYGPDVWNPDYEMFLPTHQFFMLGIFTNGTDTVNPVAQLELGHATEDVDREHRFQAGPAAPVLKGHRWHLYTFLFDLQAADKHACGELVLDEGATWFHLGSESGYDPAYLTVPGDAADLTLPDLFGPHILSLGRRRQGDEPQLHQKSGTAPEATFDELAVYDFGPQGANDMVFTKTYAQRRYRDGRYHKGAAYWAHGQAPPDDAAGAWISAPLELPAGSLLREVRWTWRRPSNTATEESPGVVRRPTALPGDYPGIELVKRDLAAPAYLWAGSRAGSPTLGSWKVDRRAAEPFRLRVLFLRRTGTMDLDTPILESPVLDDLTVLYAPPGSPAFRGWSEAP